MLRWSYCQFLSCNHGVIIPIGLMEIYTEVFGREIIYYLGFALKYSNITTNKSLEGMNSIYKILIIEAG